MSTFGIQAEKLTKHYTINLANQRHDALRDQFSYGFQLLLRRDGRQHTETFWALTTFRVRSNSEVSWGLLDETASKNIYPQDIKEIVCSHPAIHDGQAVAFGLYNADLGTEDITQSQPVNRHAQLVKIR